jgi:hypothetical protein
MFIILNVGKVDLPKLYVRNVWKYHKTKDRQYNVKTKDRQYNVKTKDRQYNVK